MKRIYTYCVVCQYDTRDMTAGHIRSRHTSYALAAKAIARQGHKSFMAIRPLPRAV